MVHPRHQAN
ncbi:hypothetical protein YPPY91_4590, partial [Yersinia pestis PY-91]